jgi:hypothetical protein
VTHLRFAAEDDEDNDAKFDFRQETSYELVIETVKNRKSAVSVSFQVHQKPPRSHFPGNAKLADSKAN